MAKLHSGNFVITLDNILKVLELSEDVEYDSVAITDVEINGEGNIEFTIVSAEFFANRKATLELGFKGNNKKRQVIGLTEK